MKPDLYQKVKTKEVLAILADESGKVLWESKESPVSALFHTYFEGGFSDVGNMSLYTNQAGIAMGIMTEKLPVRECHAVKVSEGGLNIFKANHVSVTYEAIIPLVKSSKDESKICPIEQFLYEHKDRDEQWEFLRERFAGEEGLHSSCNIKRDSRI